MVYEHRARLKLMETMSAEEENKVRYLNVKYTLAKHFRLGLGFYFEE